MGKSKKTEKKNNGLFIAGIEFLKLTHWDRYILNEHIAYLEKKLFPEVKLPERYANNELWQGNQRRFYRLDTNDIDIELELDFRPSRLKIFNAKILNLSPTGCCVLLPNREHMEVSTRIPRINLDLKDSVITCPARVIYISDKANADSKPC